MARLLFPDEGSRLAYRVRGTDLRAVANSTATLYSDAAGTILADVRSYDGTLTPGPSIPGSVVTVDAYSRLPLFWGPDAVDTLYAVIYGGPPAPVTARFDERIDALETQVAALGGSISALVQPYGQSLIIMGDSHATFNGGTSIATPVQALGANWDSKGYFNWANVALRHGFGVVGNAGIGGQNSTQIAARFNSDVVAHDPDWVVLLAGTNDTSSVTTIANLTAMYDAARVSGIQVIACTIPPNNSATLSVRQEYLKTNRFIRDYCRSHRGMFLADIGVAIADPATTWQALSGTLQTDNIHFAPQGAALAGRIIADAIRPFMPLGNDLLGSSQGDPSNLLANPMMTGTGATAPTSWANVGTNTISYVPRTDGVTGSWCQQAVTSTNTGGLTSNANVGAALAVGDSVYATIEFECDSLEVGAPASKQALLLTLQFFNGSTFVSPVSDCYWDTSYANVRYPLTSGVLLTPTAVVPIATTLAQVFVQGRGLGNFRWHRAAIRKVN